MGWEAAKEARMRATMHSYARLFVDPPSTPLPHQRILQGCACSHPKHASGVWHSRKSSVRPIITPSKRDKFEFSAIIGAATGIAGSFKETWSDEF